MSGGGKGEVGAAGAAGTHSQATNPTAGENENRGQKVCVATNPHLAELARQYKPHLAQLARQYNPHLAELARQYMEDGNDDSKTSVLTDERAILIFTSRSAKSGKLRDSSSSKLAEEHGVTTKAVRDIWNLRTWVWTTMPYWSDDDMKAFLKKRLCADCKASGVKRLEDTCDKCKIKRRRGRPMGSKDKKQRIRRSHSDLVGGPQTFPEVPAGAMAHFPLGMVDVSQHMQQQMQQGFMNPALLAQMQGVPGVGAGGAGGAGFPMLGLPAFPMTCMPWAGVQLDAQQQMQNVSQLSMIGYPMPMPPGVLQGGRGSSGAAEAKSAPARKRGGKGEAGNK